MRKVTQLVSRMREMRFWATSLLSSLHALPPLCLSFIPAVLQWGGGRRCGLHFQAVDQCGGMGWDGRDTVTWRQFSAAVLPGKVTPLPDSASLTPVDGNNHIGQSSRHLTGHSGSWKAVDLSL